MGGVLVNSKNTSESENKRFEKIKAEVKIILYKLSCLLSW